MWRLIVQTAKLSHKMCVTSSSHLLVRDFYFRPCCMIEDNEDLTNGSQQNAIFQLPEEADEEGDEAHDHVGPLGPPHGSNHVVLHAKDHSGYDDGGQGSLGDEGTVGGEEGQGGQDQSSGVNAAKGSAYAGSCVDSGTGKRASCWVGTEEGTSHVAQTQSHHLLIGINWLSSSWNDRVCLNNCGLKNTFLKNNLS